MRNFTYRVLQVCKVLLNCFSTKTNQRYRGIILRGCQFVDSIHLLNLITILQWYTEINRKQVRYLAHMLQIWHAWRKRDIFMVNYIF